MLVISLAVLLNTLGYVLYFLQIKRGDSEPKLISWWLWSFLSVLNFLSYREMTDLFLSMQFFSDALLCVAIFIYAYFHKKIVVWSREDYEVLGLGILAIIIWWQFKEAVFANVIVFFCYIISFYPMIKEVIKNPNCENPLSWYICTLGYGLHIYAIYLEENSENLDYLNPITLFVLHLVIALFAKKKEIFENPND